MKECYVFTTVLSANSPFFSLYYHTKFNFVIQQYNEIYGFFIRAHFTQLRFPWARAIRDIKDRERERERERDRGGGGAYDSRNFYRKRIRRETLLSSLWIKYWSLDLPFDFKVLRASLFIKKLNYYRSCMTIWGSTKS